MSSYTINDGWTSLDGCLVNRGTQLLSYNETTSSYTWNAKGTTEFFIAKEDSILNLNIDNIINTIYQNLLLGVEKLSKVNIGDELSVYRKAASDLIIQNTLLNGYYYENNGKNGQRKSMQINLV
jgi:hypothetical protein